LVPPLPNIVFLMSVGSGKSLVLVTHVQQILREFPRLVYNPASPHKGFIMLLSRLALPIAVLALAFAGIIAWQLIPTSAVGIEPDAKESVESPFAKDLLKAAADYKTWGRVDDEARWSPFYCRAPDPAQPAFSASQDEQTHGQKLYSLFAKKRNGYLAIAATKSAAVGQIIVKQSWIPEEITDPKEQSKKINAFEKIQLTQAVPEREPHGTEDHFHPYVWKDGKVFKASKQADLFVMMKLDPKTPGTDDGWVYATLTSDGKTLTSAGMIESCMKCHRETKTDRLFGIVH
jgi:hypothetical protein